MASDNDPDTAALTAVVRQQLRQAREGRGWTFEELAARLEGISPRMLADLEEGKTEFRFVEFIQICSALNIEPGRVVVGAERVVRSTRDK
jgi:transcriptional regulator with XRE-family HTH domain